MTRDHGAGPDLIIFDLGRVLADIAERPFVSIAARFVETGEQAVVERLRDVEVPFETGLMDTAEALAYLMETPGSPWCNRPASPARQRAERLLAATLASRFTPIPETIELAHALASQGRRLALASNTNPLDINAIRTSYPDVLAPFADRLFLSYELGVMKPDDSFFHAITDRLGVKPESSLFIDDKPENVDVAQACGMRGIVYRSPGQLHAELTALVGDLTPPRPAGSMTAGFIRIDEASAWSLWREYCESAAAEAADNDGCRDTVRPRARRAMPRPTSGGLQRAGVVVDHFGDSPSLATELLGLVLNGRKRATATALWTAEAGGAPLPYPGLYSIVVDGDGVARCILRTDQVKIVPFDEVSADFARAEGEDDGSLDSWRREHETYYRRELPRFGREFVPWMPVLCERFRLVWPPERADD